MINWITTDKLKLAQIRYYDKEKHACEIPDIKPFVFLFNVNGSYVNIFNPVDAFPVYDRTPYCNTTLDGEDYGNKLQLVNGEEEDGLCYVIENYDPRDIFKKKLVCIADIEKYIFNSHQFFIDRLQLLDKEKRIFSNGNYRKKRIEDIKNMAMFEQFVNQCSDESKTFTKLR